ncbi:unnamed protein product [Aphis gossypii]|uniref:Uncharacterized protein n=1 Tax=Aphis gossypii TaxID=80765 RepID=A0A9P0IR91_APHGO|nr:unnamed protein product [Aphis gossypii]
MIHRRRRRCFCQLHVVDWAGKGKLRKKNTTDRATDTVPPQQTQFTTFHLDSFIIILMHGTILSLTTTIRTPHPRNPYSDTISLIRLLCCCYHHHRMYNNNNNNNKWLFMLFVSVIVRGTTTTTTSERLSAAN